MAATITAPHYLNQVALLRLMLVMALVMLPHLWNIPVWAGALVLAIGAWRAAAAMKQWPLPPGWLRALLAIAAFLGVQASFGRLNGQAAGVTLLAVMVMLKLTEMRARRDVLVVVSLCYFILLTHFLYSQELWTILYLLVCAVAITSVLIEVNHHGDALSPRITLRLGASLVAQALPLMVVFFILFPRIPGPLWGLPADAGAARSGISDSMSPGDISRLVESDEIAFRVRFEGAPPPMKDRYWRGPVFAYTDGARWRAPFRGDDYFIYYSRDIRLGAYEEPQVEVVGGAVRYRIMLEPHRQNWLFALDMPSPEALPPDTHMSGYHQLLSRKLVRDPVQYDLTSYTRYRLQPELPRSWHNTMTRLPADRNPRTLALARSWREEGLDDAQIVFRAVGMFRDQDFYYTLHPPELGADMVDEFLFGTRRGFCEHYASAFTTLMRAADIPARVVVGYQGGELNAVGDYYVVRQADAHAWSEVWLPGGGWMRVDPTAAVAPSRIEQGISAALATDEVPGFLRREGSGLWYWRLQADVAWDWVNVMWDRWFLAYNDRTQFDVLSRIGLGDWQNMVFALTILTVGLMSLVGFFLLLQMRPAVPADRALVLWRRATRKLARAGIPQDPHEGPADYAQRVAMQRPDLAQVMARLRDFYLNARYLGDPDSALERELAMAVRALKP